MRAGGRPPRPFARPATRLFHPIDITDLEAPVFDRSRLSAPAACVVSRHLREVA